MISGLLERSEKQEQVDGKLTAIPRIDYAYLGRVSDESY